MCANRRMDKGEGCHGKERQNLKETVAMGDGKMKESGKQHDGESRKRK